MTGHEKIASSTIDSTASGRSFAVSCSCGKSFQDQDIAALDGLFDAHISRKPKNGVERSEPDEEPKNGAESAEV